MPWSLALLLGVVLGVVGGGGEGHVRGETEYDTYKLRTETGYDRFDLEECPFFSLEGLEASVYSQNGEDGVLLGIFSMIGFTDRVYVEFGVENGNQCNTRMLREYHNFTGLLMDGGFENETINLRREFLTVDNIVDLFRKYDVPHIFDLLSIDLDMFDFWILSKILNSYKPRVIVAEVNPTLGHNIFRQSHLNFMSSFRYLNSMPLVVNHPYTMKQNGWDGSRYSGANPLAFQLLANEFGYEMVYCESCGVNCFFVLKSAMPDTCPKGTSYPTPNIHYPCYGTGEANILGHKSDPLQRDPILLSSALVRQIVRGEIDKLVDEKFSSHMLNLKDKKIVDRNEMSYNINELSSNSSVGDINLNCNCLKENSCPLPDESAINASLNIFHSYFELYNIVASPRQNNMNQPKEYPSFSWTCYLLSMLKNSSLCEDLAKQLYQKALHSLQVGSVANARNAAEMGFKFNSNDNYLYFLLNYLTINDFLLESSASIYSLERVEVLIDGNVRAIGVGAGICDNIRYRTQHHPTLWDHHLIIYNKLSSRVIQESFGGHLLLDDNYSHIPKIIAKDDVLFGSEGPYFASSYDIITKYFHDCFSKHIFEEARRNIETVCHKRHVYKTVLIYAPPFSGSTSLDKLINSGKNDGSVKFFRDFSLEILKAIGCEHDVFMWSSTCKQELKSLANNFLPNISANFGGAISQFIYEERLRSPIHLLVLSDPLLCFVSPLLKDPLGSTRVVVPLLSPAEVINCWSLTSEKSLEVVTDLYTFYFSSMIQTIRIFDDVLFVGAEVDRVADLSKYFKTDNYSEELQQVSEYSPCNYTLSAEEESRILELIPNWILECVNVALRHNSVISCAVPQ